MTFSKPRYKGRPTKPFNERKVQIVVSVKRKHYKIAERKIKSLLKQYE